MRAQKFTYQHVIRTRVGVTDRVASWLVQGPKEGFSPDWLQNRGYLERTHGTARDLASKIDRPKVEACQDKVSPMFCIESQKYLMKMNAKRVQEASFLGGKE